MECIQPVALIIIDRLWDPIARRVNYFTKIGENNDDLQNQLKELTASRDDLKREVERAEREGKLPKNEVKVWLEKADENIKNVENMQEEFQANKKCFYGWCLDCCSYCKLGKRIVKATQYLEDLKAQKNSFGEIVVHPLQETVQELAITTIGEGTSTMGILDRVWNWLMDAKTGIIGIWGKGGVGKTTLVKKINNKLHGTQHFEVIIFVTVSRDWNMKKLRNDIGKMIGEEIYLQISKEEDETRASTLLFNKLKGKRFLLILDDMWEKVDLEKLGVPAPKGNSGCKIIITTRNIGVCNGMETDEEIMVETLSDMEAWELFKGKVGNIMISSELESIARDVCKECQGLPLAIIVVGRALRKKTNRHVWENARKILETSQFRLGDMQEEVYSPLKFSYDHLRTDNLRDCFLYCSLFSEDYEIKVDDLIEYWTMEGFFEEADESLERASEMGHYLLEELIDSCLLEKYSKNSVKMHDLIRDMAIKITLESKERGSRFLVRAGVGLQECPEVEKWEGKDRISLMGNEIKSLPEEPKCTELFTLFLQENEFLKDIPQSFFKQMKNLCVLDISYTDVVSLPSSISELGSLQALILRCCRFLQSVDHVGRLKQLQLLDLTHTRIVGLPREIKQLTRLRRLNLSHTEDLAHIPVDIIVSLSLLEDLEMWGSFYFRRSDERKALIENLGRLSHLSYFSAEIPNGLCTSSKWEFLLRDKLKSFRLRIGDRPEIFSALKGRGRCLDIGKNANVSQEVVGFLQHAESLRLYDHDELRTISAMGARNLKRLKACLVWACYKIENVVITEEAEERILLNLEILVLFSLPNLRSIWEGNGTPGSFGRIKHITISECDNLMYLFSSNVLQLLNSLEELDISLCPRMVEIVTGEVGNGVIALPRLRSISLRVLPELTRMWEGVLYLESLQEINVAWCTSLRQLAIDFEKTRELGVIRGEREWWDSLEWLNDSSKTHFQNIFKLVTHDDPYPHPYEVMKKYFS